MTLSTLKVVGGLTWLRNVSRLEIFRIARVLTRHIDARIGTVMPRNQISYVEFPATDVVAMKTFYGELFGWTFLDFGDDYAAVESGGLEAGINADPASRSKAPLVMLETSDITAMLTRVQTAGGTITVPIFQYPGGRRFHFVDPNGNELAVIQPDV